VKPADYEEVAMARHVMFDATERLFSKGQRALHAQEFALAIKHLTHAIETDPEYPHLYRCLGIAQSELGKPREAEAALQKAATLAPDNFVFPMELGILQLDADDPQGAEAHFRRAQNLSPQNALVAGYLLLCRWDKGERQALRDLQSRLRDLPHPFQARVLLRVEHRRLTQAGPSACIEAIRPTASFSAPARFWPSWLVRRADKRHLRKAKEALFQFRFDDVLLVLHDRPGLLMSDRGGSLASLARRGAVTALVDALDWLAPEGADPGVQDDRRELLLRLADHQYALSDYEAAEKSLSQWRSTFRESIPKHHRPVHATVLLRMADIRTRRAAYADAKRLCAEARALRSSPELDWIDAVAHLGLKDRRGSRHLLESVVDGQFFKTDAYVGAFLETVK
jgi:tetratricopeptide (TPR) repeat protein